MTSVPRSWTERPAPYPRDEGLDALFVRQVAERPHAIAVQMGMQTMTYRALDDRASRLANALREAGVRDEMAVGILMGQKLDHVVAQLAIIKAGGSIVPLDPESPAERLNFILGDASVRVAITDAEFGERLPEGPWLRRCLDCDVVDVDRQTDRLAVESTSAEHRTHVLYTSGSTGKPKGAEIVARAISRLVLGTDYVQIGPSDRVAQLANFAFDAAIFEIWAPLLNGGRVVLLPKPAILDPHAFRAKLVEQGISVMFLTTALFNFTAQACPNAFGFLRCLLVGGERANPQMMEAVLRTAPPQTFLHVYGPTEGTTFTTSHPLTLGEVRGNTVAIGRPIANTQVFILDPAGAPSAVGEAGELHIGGDGLARGYLHRPDLTREKFFELAGLVPGQKTRVYRTGDVARFRSDGAIEFLGRTDFQVKIRGYRVELEEVEASLRADDQVSTAAVAVHESEVGEHSLFAHVVPRDVSAFQLGQLLRNLRATLPNYMVPARFLVVEALPLNANGKVDRRALAAATERAMARPMRESLETREAHDDLEATLMVMWCKILEVARAAPEDNFLALGGTSLLAARMVLGLRDALGVSVPVHVLYRAGSFRNFVETVRGAGRGASIESDQDESAAWIADARLPDDLVDDIRTAASEPLREAPFDNVLLTGATGFLGAFLLHDLLTQTDARVTCLVRAASSESGAARIQNALDKYGLSTPSLTGRVRVVGGDLKAPHLGLSAETYDVLAHELDVILHNAAQVNYVQPYSTHKAANVDGALEVLRLAVHGKLKPLHHVSTIAVFGPAAHFAQRTRIFENEDLDAYVDGLRFDIGYSQSKWVAEKMLAEARVHGARISVYRPGFIMGDGSSGAGNVNDFMARLVKGCIQVGAYPDLPGQRKEFVPVDYVSGAIVRIASQPHRIGGAYHLVPPRVEESILLNDFFEMLRDAGYALEKLDYAAWIERLLHHSRVDDNALYSLIPMLSERVYRGETTRWELYENMPAYDTVTSVAALGDGTGRFRPMDRMLLARYLRYFVRTGFLEEPPERPHRTA